MYKGWKNKATWWMAKNTLIGNGNIAYDIVHEKPSGIASTMHAVGWNWLSCARYCRRALVYETLPPLPEYVKKGDICWYEIAEAWMNYPAGTTERWFDMGEDDYEEGENDVVDEDYEEPDPCTCPTCTRTREQRRGRMSRSNFGIGG